VLFLWPGFFILHYSKEETFVWPNGKQWLFICSDKTVPINPFIHINNHCFPFGQTNVSSLL
jgi:hypothetical protein